MNFRRVFMQFIFYMKATRIETLQDKGSYGFCVRKLLIQTIIIWLR